MRIAFNARLLRDASLRGWNRYTINLLAELSNLGVSLFLYADQPLHESHLARLPAGNHQVRMAPPMRYFQWEQHWLPKQCAIDRVDLLHSPFNFGLPWRSSVPRVLTLHDAIGKAYHQPRTSWREKLQRESLQSDLYLWIARRRAHHLITVSEHAKQDLMKWYGIPADRITVIYEGAEARFSVPIDEVGRKRVRQTYGLFRPFVFYVGGWELRKNIPFLVRAFAAAKLNEIELALAGGTAEQQAALRELAESLGVAERTHLLGWVADADLPALYAEALCFVYPSEYEGFGLQLCEAMAVGTPVLAARRSCLPEVLGDGGETFSLERPEELSEYLVRLAAQPAYWQELSVRSKCRGGMFSWRRMAEQTLTVYHRLITG